MYYLKCFRSGNTLRVSLPQQLRYSLNAGPGDLLKLEEITTLQWRLTNASRAARLKEAERKK